MGVDTEESNFNGGHLWKRVQKMADEMGHLRIELHTQTMRIPSTRNYASTKPYYFRLHLDYFQAAPGGNGGSIAVSNVTYLLTSFWLRGASKT